MFYGVSRPLCSVIYDISRHLAISQVVFLFRNPLPKERQGDLSREHPPHSSHVGHGVDISSGDGVPRAARHKHDAAPDTRVFFAAAWVCLGGRPLPQAFRLLGVWPGKRCQRRGRGWGGSRRARVGACQQYWQRATRRCASPLLCVASGVSSSSLAGTREWLRAAHAEHLPTVHVVAWTRVDCCPF